METTKRSGTQSIERAILVLCELAKHGKFGIGLLELAARCGIDHATTHRIAKCLVRTRMAQQRESNRNYLVGPLVFELGLALPAHAEFQAACRPPLTRVAERFNACAVLYLRSGVDWVCAARAGPSVYGGSILEVGTRRPLLSAVGGAAILMALAPAEAHAIVAQNKKQLKRLSDASLLRLEKFVKRSASQGFAFAQGEVSKGVHTFGIPLCDEHEQPFGSLALAGSADEFPASRARAVIEVLRAEAQTIASELQRVFLVR